MGAAKYTLEDYNRLIGNEVEYFKPKAHQISKGILVEITEDGKFALILEPSLWSSVTSFVTGKRKKDPPVKVPITHIREKNFIKYKIKTNTPPPMHSSSASSPMTQQINPKHDRCQQSSKRRTFIFASYRYTEATESTFKVDNEVIWMLPNHLWSASNPYIGRVEFVASHETVMGELNFCAIVEFYQDTSSFLNYMGPEGRNRNFVPLNELMQLEEWRKTLVHTSKLDSTPKHSNAPRPYGWVVTQVNKLSNEEDTCRSRSRSTISSKHAGSDETLKSVHSKRFDRDNKRYQTLPHRGTKKGPAVQKHLPMDSEMWMTVIKIDLLSRRLEQKGTYHGIQGHLNSCYMDVSIFCMFAFTNAFDDFVKRDKSADGEGLRHRVKKILRRDIVEMLRENYFVPWENMNKLRAILVQHVGQGYQKSCMDVEELMLSLFNLINAPKLFMYDDGEMDYIHQIILPNEWNESKKVRYLCVQELLENSFRTSEVELNEKPNRAFIIKLPVSDGKLIPCQGVIPNLTVRVPEKNTGFVEMHLHAVVCLRNSHFVAFVRADATDPHQRWVFMNSNPITSKPEVKVLVGINEMINGALQTIGRFSGEEPHCDGSKLFRDAYICIYLP